MTADSLAAGARLGIALLMLAQPALAQQEPADRPPTPPTPAPTAPTGAPRPAEPRPGPKPVAPAAKPAAEPAKPGVPNLEPGAIPGLESTDFKIAPAPLLSERTTLTLRRGSMIRLPTGEPVFVFHPDSRGRAERPMVLLPSQRLQQIEQVAADRAEPPVFLMTGQVFVYQGLNYLLPTAYSIVQPPSEAPAAEPAPPPPPPATDPQVQDLIKQLESQRRGPRAVERTAPPAPAVQAEPAKGLMPEGQAVVRRRGRMVRGGGGDWEFAFDRGSAGDPQIDRPMVLSPCLNLQRMEQQVAIRGEGTTFEVSGQVRTYRGRNHLAPTLFQVYGATDLQPRQ